jgi:hypothetical protein
MGLQMMKNGHNITLGASPLSVNYYSKRRVVSCSYSYYCSSNVGLGKLDPRGRAATTDDDDRNSTQFWIVIWRTVIESSTSLRSIATLKYASLS